MIDVIGYARRGLRSLVAPIDFPLLLITLAIMAVGLATVHSATFDGNPQAQAALGLSTREMEVLALIAGGLSNKEIARQLDLSPHTVKTHVARLLAKLDASRRTDALRRARELGLLP